MDAGITLLESSSATVTGNVFEKNAFGTRISVGSKDNLFRSNLFSDNGLSVNLYEGIDVPYDLPTGRPTDNLFDANEFREEGLVVDAQNTDGLQFTNNLFLSSASSFSFEDSTAVLLKENFGMDDSEFKVVSTCFDPLTDLQVQEVNDNTCDVPGKVLDFASPTSCSSPSPTSTPSLSPSLSPTPSPSLSPSIPTTTPSSIPIPRSSIMFESVSVTTTASPTFALGSSGSTKIEVGKSFVLIFLGVFVLA